MSDEIKVKVNSYGAGRPLSLVYFDPITGKKKAKSSGTTDWREAERLAGELEKELRAGRYAPPSKLTWSDFRERFRQEHLAGKAPASRKRYEAALGYVNRLMGPDRMAKLTSGFLSEFVKRLRAGDPKADPPILPMKETTIATTLRHVKAALRWAVSMGLLAKLPDIRMPKKSKGQSMMRGRPITGEEFERMLGKVEVVLFGEPDEDAPELKPEEVAARQSKVEAWKRYLTGLWLSGLRLEESIVLSWDDDAPFSVDLSGKHPAFRIYSEAQKARRDEVLPMTPDFAEWLLATPKADRRGRVFQLGMAGDRAGRIVSKIGNAAKVVVNKAEGKTASAHDLRRAFGTRWAKRVMPAVLQRLMRHSNITTTMGYYVAMGADEVAGELWAKFGGSDEGKSGAGNTSGNNGPQAEESARAGDER